MSDKEYDLIPAGDHPARIVHVAMCGMHPNPPYKGQARPSTPRVWITYELVDQFTEYEGEKKPRWVSGYTFGQPWNAYTQGDKSKLANLMKTLGAAEAEDLVGKACIVSIKHNEGKGKYEGRTFVNFAGAAAWPTFAGECGALVNEGVYFDLYNPDNDAWYKLPKWIKEYISEAENFNGSFIKKKEAEEAPAEEAQDLPEDDFDDDTPF